jgi:long-chain acyl-CoA synthetase
MELARPILERKGGELAVTDELGSYTWSELNDRVNRLINGLRGEGFAVGDTIAVLCSNRHEYMEANSAAFNAGGILVPVNWHLAPDELHYILSDSKAKVLIADPKFGQGAADAAERAGVDIRLSVSGGSIDGFASYEELLDSASGDEPADQVGGGNMFYTSGTTGQPKGVKSSALQPGGPVDALLATVQGLASLLDFEPDGRVFVNSPLYHAGPYAFAMTHAAFGGYVLLRDKFDAAESLKLMDENDIRQAYYVPTHFVRFLKLDDDTKRSFKGESIKFVWHTGAPCPPDVKRQMIDWWGPVIYEYYGASEGVGAGTKVSPQEWLERPGTVGKPLPTCELLILDDDGNRLGPRQVGQVWFKNLLGVDFEYLGAPEKTAGAHREPGVYTYGDVGYTDEDGYLFLSDRKIDMIVSGGVNIYPAEIEAVLITHPKVADVAVFGVPNDEFGEEVKAAVQLAPGVSDGEGIADELKRFAREKLAGYKVPRSVDVHEDFPRTPTGKLQKRLLRDPYWEGRSRAI